MTITRSYLTFLLQAKSTFFDEDEGWTTINFPPGFYQVREWTFNGWYGTQILFGNEWYDLD